MLTNRAFWASQRFPLLAPDGESGGSGGGTGSESESQAKTDADKGKEGTGEKGDDKEALRRLGEQRDAARQEAQAAKEERDALLKEKTEREAAEQARKDKEAAESGKWEELATKREGELKTAKDEATSLKAENDQLRQAIDEALKATVATLPASIKEILDDTFADDDVLGRYTWLHKPSVQKQLADANKETARGNGSDPKNRGSGNGVADTAAQHANQRRYG